MPLDSKVKEKLLETYERIKNEGKVTPNEKLEEYYKIFKQRFGIEQLMKLDGEALLEKMHLFGRDCLPYWLEFKNDDEFPAIFGSITGSSFNYKIYRNKKTNLWMSGSPTNPREITVPEAIEITLSHRDQLAKGVEFLTKLPENASDDEYKKLQKFMDEQVGDISNTAWAHKYFSLIFPTKLESFHVTRYQQYYLIKMLQEPCGSGRYEVGGQFARLAKELGISLYNLPNILGNQNANPKLYWRLNINGTKLAWKSMLDNHWIAMEWENTGGFSTPIRKIEFRNEIIESLKKHYDMTPSALYKTTNSLMNFTTAEVDDIVLACDNDTVFGIGKISGPYFYQNEGKNDGHRRNVEWLSVGKWKIPKDVPFSYFFDKLDESNSTLVEVENKILYNPFSPSKPGAPKHEGIIGRIQQILDRKGQVIIYGPPGTGKTYWAEKTARELTANYDGANNKVYVRMCTFHSAYGYEDFIEGYHPLEKNGNLLFELQDGIFTKLCKDAEADPDHKYYLIIDEINRGDIPRIFGELLTILEFSKRNKTVLLPLTGKPFSVPKNVYVIGTMNTADRSISLLDTALRRRFGFVELMPDSSVLEDTVIESIPLGPWLEELNLRILQHIGHDARNLQIGHSYLMTGDKPIQSFDMFVKVLQDDILPLLQEYCYEDYQALEKILGTGFVDCANQQFNDEIIYGGNKDKLISALLEPCPDIKTTTDAVVAEAKKEENESLVNIEDSDGS